MRASCELERVRVPRRGIIASIFALKLHGAMPFGWMIVVFHANPGVYCPTYQSCEGNVAVLGENIVAMTKRKTGWMQILSIACV